MARVDLKHGSLTEEIVGTVTRLPIDATHRERAAAAEKAVATDSPIAISFAKFNDGRGFTLARLLRSEHGYLGEILATGHPIPDQALHLLRSGFDSVEVSDPASLPQWQRSLEIYSGSYQPAARNPLSLRRQADALGSPNQPISRKPATDKAPLATAVELTNDFA